MNRKWFVYIRITKLNGFWTGRMNYFMYLKETKVEDIDIKKKSCEQRCRLGKNFYLSKVEITFQIVELVVD